MKFGIIDPEAKAVDIIDVAERDAESRARLPKEKHHGILCRLDNDHRLACVVDDFGFFVPPPEQHYFAIDGRLLAGRAFIYEVDRGGRTVDLSDEAAALIRSATWFESAEQVELAIAAGTVPRPELAVNGDVLWSWPEPPPPDMAERIAERTK